jgi:hypothetical protein
MKKKKKKKIAAKGAETSSEDPNEMSTSPSDPATVFLSTTIKPFSASVTNPL